MSEMHEDNVKRFADLFSGLERAYGTYEIDEVRSVGKDKVVGKAITKQEPVEEELYRRHLAGQMGLGIVPIKDDARCVFAALDIDDYGLDIQSLNRKIHQLGLPLVVCRTKSGGAHCHLHLQAPVSCEKVDSKMARMAAALGFTNCERFPKQVKLKKEDCGNWINLPYQNVDGPTTRYALDATGKAIASLEAYLDFAESKRLNEGDLDELEIPDPLYSDGPPCLERIWAEGVASGSRNEVLWQTGVYERLRGDGWEDEVEQASIRMSPPMLPKETRTVMKSLSKGSGFYKCRSAPFVSRCDRNTCLQRRFGIGESGEKFGVLIPNDHIDNVESSEQIFGILKDTNEFFRRGEVLVRMNKNQMVSVVRPGEFRAVIDKHLTTRAMVYNNSKELVAKRKRMSRDQANTLLESDGRFELPELNLVVEMPLVMPDRTVLHQGYNPLHKIYVRSEVAVPEIEPDRAYKMLTELLRDFKFVTRYDRARAFVSFVTPALKMGGFISGPVPIDITEANFSQAGKTLRTKLVQRLYGVDDPAIVILKEKGEGGVGSFTESVGAAIVKGSPFIMFDNVRGRLESQYLEMAITSGKNVPVRIAYKGQVEIDLSRTVFQLTSNGLDLTQDVANRSVITRIMKQPDNYVYCDWKGEGILDWAWHHRNEYMGAIHAIVKEWISEGKPTIETGEHDFREWARIVQWFAMRFQNGSPLESGIQNGSGDQNGSAIQNGSGSIFTGHREIQRRASTPMIKWAEEIAEYAAQNGRLGKDMKTTALYHLSEDAGAIVPGLNTEAPIPTLGRKLAVVFRDSNRVWTGSYWFCRESRVEWSESQSKDVEVKYYRFEIEPEEGAPTF